MATSFRASQGCDEDRALTWTLDLPPLPVVAPPRFLTPRAATHSST